MAFPQSRRTSRLMKVFLDFNRNLKIKMYILQQNIQISPDDSGIDSNDDEGLRYSSDINWKRFTVLVDKMFFSDLKTVEFIEDSEVYHSHFSPGFLQTLRLRQGPSINVRAFECFSSLLTEVLSKCSLLQNAPG